MIAACLRRPPRRWLVAGAVCVLLLIAVATVAQAAPLRDTTPPAQADNSACLTCHGKPGLTMQLPGANGQPETLSLSVDQAAYDSSVHGAKGQACTTCHAGFTGYPHPKLDASIQTRRDFQVAQYAQCKTCHEQQYTQTLDSNHGRALAAGNKQAAICTDCHGSHDISDPATPRAKMSQTCEACHSTIYQQYASSVHGAALLQQSNPDVAVCTDCHGAHRQEDPTTAAFRLQSPQICASCHANATLMQKYGISTDIMNSYVADFHGTTVQVFERTSPDQPTNKAVCSDCHGVHDIKPVDDTTATVVKQNLLKTCQRCHPNATTNFPDSWVGHFPPSAARTPWVYYVNLFYTILIPVVIGGMLLFVILDAFRRLRDRSMGKGA